ncbi:MAG: phosphoglucomutase/phosphomannomutase family protein [Candidatus Omnitrophota bacterium]|jgi:phosphomannomutase
MSSKKDIIKFGTDGWRAVIADTFTFENVSVISQAISEWIKRDLENINGRKRVAVGYDTRFMSAEFAEIVACVLAQNNIDVVLSDAPIPTPALSYGVTVNACVAGIMITASHNPYKFNGVKIKTAQGGGASKDITNKVEEYISETPVQAMDFIEAKRAGRIVMQNYKIAYLKFIRNYIDLKKIKTARFKVLMDAMHGSGDSLIAEVLKGTSVRLSLMREDINPYFDGKKPEPVVQYLDGIIKRVKTEGFDLGLVLDGDADRIAAVATGGEFLHPQKILGLLILHLVRNRGRKGGIVKTVCGTTMLDKIAAKLGLKLYETPVGFKYISDLMVTENIVAGGEEAGGMGFQDYIPERDGTLAGLLLLEMMVYQKKNIKKIVEEMEKEFGRYYYQRSDVKLGVKPFDVQRFKETTILLGKKVVGMKDSDGVKLICEDESWLMLRPSGTEPLVRAYSEAKTLKRAKELIQYGDKILRS